MTRIGDIRIVGADANNLRSVNVTLPLHQLTAIVGVSGSGKSSLVEDTLAAEAATRMRRFLNVDVGSPSDNVRAFVGELPPALLVRQHTFRASTRTTVGTSTPFLRLLRRLFIRYSYPYADAIGEFVPEPSAESFAAWVCSFGRGPVIVWAVPVQLAATTGVTAAQRLLAAGMVEATVFSETDRGKRAETGTPVLLSRFKPLRPDVRHSIECRVGTAQAGEFGKLLSTLEIAWRASEHVFVELPELRVPALKRAFSFGLDSRIHRVHPRSPVIFRVANSHLLSFNAPDHDESGACPTCRGLGVTSGLQEATLIPRPERSVNAGAIALWTEKNYRHVNIQHDTIEGLRGRAGFDPDVPWRELPSEARSLLLEGSTELVEDRDPRTKRKTSGPHRFDGFRAAILERAGRPTPAGRALQAFVGSGPCQDCHGSRWSEAARALRVDGRSLPEMLATPFNELKDVRLQCDASTWENVVRVAESFVKVGLGHLTGDRGMLGVSDGESRRSRLAGALNSRLAGLLLILDEPGRGLHEADLADLGDAILEATRRHTVVMSEHRQRLVDRSDSVVTLGPGAGWHGGRIVVGASREPAQAASAIDLEISTGVPVQWLEVEGARIHNVQDAIVRIPIGTLTCIAGVSGSGKSSFVRGVLVPGVAATLPTAAVDIDEFRVLEGSWSRIHLPGIQSIHALDQSPASAQRRSLVLTFLDLADGLRRLYASAAQAKELGLAPTDFGTNSGKGRCQRCLGLGTADDGGPCSVCGGLRFGFEVLSVRMDGLNIAELLATPIVELREGSVLSVDSAIVDRLVELGVGHLALGRSLDTLSGGEIQRLRIARALAKQQNDGALFVIDEPACGLHPDDVARLFRALRHVVSNGRNTVVVIEHDPYLLRRCDYIVEFGPVGGPAGGLVVAFGAPAEVGATETPTGRALNGSLPSPKPGTRELQRAEPAPTLQDARRVRAEIRQIIGEDVEVPDEGDTVSAAAILPRQTTRRPHELADLDLAIASVLLDAAPSDEDAKSELLQTWKRYPGAVLQLHPLLDDIAVWGQRLPRSAIDQANRHIKAMGLGPPVNLGEITRSRVSGARLRPTRDTDEARSAALRDGWAVGNGYVELVEAGRVVAVASDRPVDLERAIVGPRRARPVHFSRHHHAGQCPECRGQGRVVSLDERLIVAGHGRVLDEALLEPGAREILKGVRRSEMVPFFRRLIQEGIWDDLPWHELSADARSIVLHGFWIRPGHGTFLKTGPEIDPGEVGHWLRWDGLIASVLSQLSRSKDAAWTELIRRSEHAVTCPVCRGSGLARHARLLAVGSRSLDAWTLEGNLHSFLAGIDALEGLPERAVLARARVRTCLAVAGGTRLTAPADPDIGQSILRRAATAFAGLPVLFE